MILFTASEHKRKLYSVFKISTNPLASKTSLWQNLLKLCPVWHFPLPIVKRGFFLTKSIIFNIMERGLRYRKSFFAKRIMINVNRINLTERR